MPTATFKQSIQHGWLKLESGQREFDADCGLDAPGLWKPVGHGPEAHRTFEVPLEILLRRVESFEPDEDPQGQVVSMVTSCHRTVKS